MQKMDIRAGRRYTVKGRMPQGAGEGGTRMTAQKSPAHRGEATKHRVNACLMQLICIVAPLLCAGGAIHASFIRLMICFLPCAVFAVFCVIRSCDIFGRVTITRDHPVLKAPLRRTLVCRLTDLRHIQIADSPLSVGGQYKAFTRAQAAVRTGGFGRPY